MNPVLNVYIESLIFATNQPISIEEIKNAIDSYFQQEVEESEIESIIRLLIDKYKNEDFSFEVIELSGGFCFMTKGAYHDLVAQYLKTLSTKKLSKAAMETLSIIAYKQPTTKGEVENIRGVNCDYAIQKLLERELVEIAGRSEGVGRPILYSTTTKFFDYFGIKDVSELPKLKEIENDQFEITSE